MSNWWTSVYPHHPTEKFIYMLLGENTIKIPLRFKTATCTGISVHEDVTTGTSTCSHWRWGQTLNSLKESREVLLEACERSSIKV